MESVVKEKSEKEKFSKERGTLVVFYLKDFSLSYKTVYIGRRLLFCRRVNGVELADYSWAWLQTPRPEIAFC
jgi:hypothetical protein